MQSKGVSYGSLDPMVPNSKDEKVLNFLSPIRDRQTDIVAYRVNVCYQKGSSRVNWIIGKEDCMQKKSRN